MGGLRDSFFDKNRVIIGYFWNLPINNNQLRNNIVYFPMGIEKFYHQNKLLPLQLKGIDEE